MRGWLRRGGFPLLVAFGVAVLAGPLPAMAAAAPTITSFSPTIGAPGTAVTITGTDFSGATAVRFNGTNAASFNVDSNTQVTAVVPVKATSGPIQVVTPLGTATSADTFTVLASGPPTIDSFSPPSGPVGTVVVITGTNLFGATSVKFGNKAAASFTVDSNTQITATVGNGTHTGPITVTTPVGTATSSTDFVVAPAGSPTISSFSPTSGSVGTSVTITGTNFTGATLVAFNLTPASTFTVNSSTQITATVASGTTTGYVHVTTPSGTGTSSTMFTVPGTPTISSFSPTSGPVGTSVTIKGSNLTGTTAVKFNGTNASSFTVNNPNQITAVVGTGTTTGPISVTTPSGTNQSLTNFTVVKAEITSFSPMRGPWGTQVVITGVALTGATGVRFNGVNASSFKVDSDTQITATVATGTTTGTITVTTPAGTLTSADLFTVVHLRTMSLSLARHLVASGNVVAIDGTMACVQVVPVKIQRRVSGSWVTVGTGFTDTSGHYLVRVPNKLGKYRARAVKVLLGNGDACARTKSSVVLNG